MSENIRVPKVLGLAASLRNARFGKGNAGLLRDLSKIQSEDDLKAYLEEQTQFRLEEFLEAGRATGQPFDKIYRNIRKLRGERGLSNSEAALAAALWGAQKEGCAIDYASLAHHFRMSGEVFEPSELKRKIIEADAIILSTPVYFGDRGSLAQSLIEFIASDQGFAKLCEGKVFGGISVGAKRNGGQETTLIYLLLDMVNLDFLVVGNSSNTTSQYGGTAVAGDVGKLHEDQYGLETSIGTGERVARIADLSARGSLGNVRLVSKLRLQLWLLADDADAKGESFFSTWADQMASLCENVDIELINFTKHEVTRCIACDICPTHLGPANEYRCIISSKNDAFVKKHEKMMEADAVLMCAFSPEDRTDVNSVYQQFVERTRYIRRDNYLLGDILFAPFVASEIGARQNLHLRMLTSSIRHHTVLHHPILAMFNSDELINKQKVKKDSLNFINTARQLTLGRLAAKPQSNTLYKPLGYEISREKADKDLKSGETAKYQRQNELNSRKAADSRITITKGSG